MRLRFGAPVFTSVTTGFLPDMQFLKAVPEARLAGNEIKIRCAFQGMLFHMASLLFDMKIVGHREDAGNAVCLLVGDNLVHLSRNHPLQNDTAIFHDDVDRG